MMYIDKLCLRFTNGVVMVMPLCLRFPDGVVMVMPLWLRFPDGVVLVMPNINKVIIDDVLDPN